MGFLAAGWDRTKAWLNHYRPRWGYVIGLFVLLLGLVVKAILDRLAPGLLSELWLAQERLRALPVGVLGWALFLLLAVLFIVGFVETSPAVARWHLRRIQGDRSQLEAARDNAIALLEQQREANQVLSDNFYKERYGTAVPRFPRLDAPDAAILLSEMEKLRPLLTSLTEHACLLVVLLCDTLRETDSEHPEHDLGEFVLDEAVGKLRKVERHFLETTALREDARGSLVAFYDRYNRLRAWVPRLAKFGHKTLGSMTEYQAWRSADGRFLDALDTVLRIHQLTEVWKACRRLDEDHGYPLKLIDQG